MNKNEQWLSDGDCAACRREKYCSKPCKSSRSRQAREFAGLMASAMLKGMADAYDKEDVNGRE